jgi:hypothetical protein
MIGRKFIALSWQDRAMTNLKATLQSDLTAATKAGDKVTLGTLRMALAAVTTEEVSGKEARELSDAEVLAVLTKEAKKRKESITAYNEAGRSDLAEIEINELAVLEKYLPTPLTDAEVLDIIKAAIAETGATDVKGMGAVMKIVQPQTAGRADGSFVASEVKKALGA